MSSINPRANIREASPNTTQAERFDAGMTHTEMMRTTSHIETPPNLAGVPLCQRLGCGFATHPCSRHTCMATATAAIVITNAAQSSAVSDPTPPC